MCTKIDNFPCSSFSWTEALAIYWSWVLTLHRFYFSSFWSKFYKCINGENAIEFLIFKTLVVIRFKNFVHPCIYHKVSYTILIGLCRCELFPIYHFNRAMSLWTISTVAQSLLVCFRRGLEFSPAVSGIPPARPDANLHQPPATEEHVWQRQTIGQVRITRDFLVLGIIIDNWPTKIDQSCISVRLHDQEWLAK